MTRLTSIELDQDVVDAASKRASEEGLSVTAYVSLLLRRAFERAPDEKSVLVYDHVQAGGDFALDPEAGETEESHRQRSLLFGGLFGRK